MSRDYQVSCAAGEFRLPDDWQIKLKLFANNPAAVANSISTFLFFLAATLAPEPTNQDLWVYVGSVQSSSMHPGSELATPLGRGAVEAF